MNASKFILFLIALLFNSNTVFAQCAQASNIYSFSYNGHTYEVVKENKTWMEAVDCAVNRNGYLVELNDEAEHDQVFFEVANNAGIVTNNTQNQFGTASLWMGGSDAGIEGNWIWDGDNDGMGPQFWSGASNGMPIGGFFTKWGISPAEPDNSGDQDHLTLIIKTTATNFGLWNDLKSNNSIYYVIEYDNLSSTQNLRLKNNLKIYPNPFENFISIDNQNDESIQQIEIFNMMGQKLKSFNKSILNLTKIELTDLSQGIYIVNIHFDNGEMVSKRIMK